MTAGATYATNATYEITHAGGTTNLSVNQRERGGEWVLLGTFTFANSQGHRVRLTDNADGTVVADAVKFLPAGAGNMYAVETDHLDTPRAVRNSAGTVVWRWDGDAFGASAPNQVNRPGY